MRTSRSALAALVAVAGLALVACGNDDSKGPAGGDSPAVTTVATPTTEAMMDGKSGDKMTDTTEAMKDGKSGDKMMEEPTTLAG